MNRRHTSEDIAEQHATELAFMPPHCPYSNCASNHGAVFTWRAHGWHERRFAPFRARRFRCVTCKRTFSTQTFRYNFWQKRPDLDSAVQNSGRSCAGNRQIASMIGCSKSTVADKVARIARHVIRFHTQALRGARRKLTGDLLFDGLGSFEHSQYHPYWLNVAVHGDSGLTIGFTDSPLRRRGAMTPGQRKRRAELELERGTPPRNSIRTGTADLLKAAMAFFFRGPATFFVSDKHPEYPKAIRDAGFTDVQHVVTAGSLPRTPINPLFEINLTDLLLRHGNSSQKRETIAFNKRRQAGLERAWLWLVWRNYMHPRHVKRNTPTPAVQAGLADRRLTFTDIFTTRQFAWRSDVPAAWERQIRRQITTPAVGRNAQHSLRYAD